MGLRRCGLDPARVALACPACFLGAKPIAWGDCNYVVSKRTTIGCTRTAAPRFSFDGPGYLVAAFAASARFRRHVWSLGQECTRRFCPGVYAASVPTVLQIGSYRFHFYSDEGVDPAHIHVRTNDGESKFWLGPTIGLARNHGVRPADLRRIEQLVFEHHDQLLRAFNEFHNR